MENKIRWRYNAQVAVEDTASQRNGFVFVDDGRDNIGSTRTAIVYEASPIPIPNMIPPMMHDMKGSSFTSGSLIYTVAIERSMVVISTPNMERMQYCQPMMRMAAMRRIPLIVK